MEATTEKLYKHVNNSHELEKFFGFCPPLKVSVKLRGKMKIVNRLGFQESPDPLLREKNKNNNRLIVTTKTPIDSREREREISKMAAYEIALHIDDEWTSSSISQCRICHEEEDEGDCKSLEAPCACSGTLKFAHRECIQRWCDEKGNTTCEICLEKYEPGYTAIPPPPIKKTRLADIAVTIRESLEVPRQNNELNNRRLLEDAAAEDEILDTNYAESPSASERSFSFYRSIAMIFTTLLLMRHLISEITGVPDHYPLTFLALLILRTGGIAIPLYIVMQTIEMIQQWRQEQRQLHEADSSPLGEDEDELMP